MDELLSLTAFITIFWRVVIGGALGAAVALLLNSLFPALPAAASFAIFFVAASVGIIWHIGALSDREAAVGRREVRISKPVAFLGIAAIGGLWGSLAEASFGAPIALVAAITAPWLLGMLFGLITKQRIGFKSTAFAMVAVLVGLATPYAITLVFNITTA